MCLNKTILVRILIFVLSTFLADSIKANTAITSGAWETGTNWSAGTAPKATDAVIIPLGLTMTVKVAGDVCASLSISFGGSLIINNNSGLAVGGNFSNAGTFTANTGSTVTFNSTANSSITGGGVYTISGTVVLNMGSSSTSLDVQDANFITGINSGGKYYFTFTEGVWKMDNTGTLNDAYNSGSGNAITIPFGVVIESDAGTMNLGKNASTGKTILSGKLFVNGGIVNVQTGQSFNSGQDFQYHVNGGLPQLYISSGTLNVGAGFNANASGDYIDFHMSGGTIVLASNGYSNWITFQLADVVGGKTFMSAGLIILQDACNANIEDLDMGGANVAATQYSVTGGTVQFGYTNTQNSATYFGIDAQPSTNYPNFDFEPGVAKNASAFTTGNINMLSLHINTNQTFDATGFPNLTITSSNGSFAFDDEGGFIQSTNTVIFSGAVNQLITSVALTSEIFYNLTIANTGGNVTLGVGTTVSNRLAFTKGLLDASNYSLTVSSGSIAITGASSANYIITGNGAATTGQLVINTLPVNTATLFPVGTSNYYLPVTVNPGANTGNSYSGYVFQGATTNALANGTPFTGPGLAQIVNAEWDLTRTAGTGNATIVLNWLASGTALEGSTFQGFGTAIGISQYTGGGWQIATGSGSVVTETATSAFSSFSEFDVGLIGVVLPVTITDFNAVRDNDMALLSWVELNNSGVHDFKIQRSSDGINYNEIGEVLANGKTDPADPYRFTDVRPAYGINYYRLLIQNNDSSNTYSSIRLINMPIITGIKMFPNPADNILNISLDNIATQYSVRLINQAGQVLQVTPVKGNSLVSMQVGTYAGGIYFIQVTGANKTIESRCIVIAH
jgi:type IX secretion system substrate protein